MFSNCLTIQTTTLRTRLSLLYIDLAKIISITTYLEPWLRAIFWRTRPELSRCFRGWNDRRTVLWERPALYAGSPSHRWTSLGRGGGGGKETRWRKMERGGREREGGIKERGVWTSSASNSYNWIAACTSPNLHADGSSRRQVSSGPSGAEIAALNLPLDFVAGPQHVPL